MCNFLHPVRLSRIYLYSAEAGLTDFKCALEQTCDFIAILKTTDLT